MLGICFFVLCAVSVGFAAAAGNMSALTDAAIDGAARAVELVLSLCGMTVLWSGVMAVLREAGMIRVLSRILSPLLRPAFPQAWRTGAAREEITAAVTANILGIGNAATPLALEAMRKLQAENPAPHEASDDMVTLTVLAASPPALLPATVIALRRAAGALQPHRIIVPVWLVSGACAVIAVVLCRAAAWAGKGRHRD